MGHLHMIRQGIQSTKEKHTDKYLEDKRKKCSVLHNCGPYHNKIRKYLLRSMRTFNHHFKQGEQIHICNVFV